MSNTAFDFLTESFLFDEKNLDNHFASFTEKELQVELSKYIDHINANYSNILKEIQDKHLNTNVYIQAFDSFRITEALIKQCCLYTNKFILDDPIYSFAYSYSTRQDNSQVAFADFMGLSNSRTLDKNDLASTLLTVKSFQFGVVCDFIKLFPSIKLLDVRGSGIPFLFSPDGFSNVREKNILDYFHNNCTIYPVEQDGVNLTIHEHPENKPCSIINIRPNNHSENIGKCFALMDTSIQSFDDESGAISLMSTRPQSPLSPEQFRSWCNQEMNKFANNFCHQLESDITISSGLSASYITNSEFVNGLFHVKNTSFNDNLTHPPYKMLSLELPIIENASLNNILSVRENEGTAFKAFRDDYEKRLAFLRTIEDSATLEKEIEFAQKEFSETRIIEMSEKIKKLRKNFFVNSTLTVAGLATSIITSGFSLISAVFTAVQGYRTYVDFRNDVKLNPTYMLWKINQKSKGD